MIVSISVTDWQTLRVLVRAEAKKEHMTGRELRLNMSRRCKDRTFLDELVALGLIAVAVKPGARKQASQWEAIEPARFRTRYKLRPRSPPGVYEYDKPYTPTVGT